MSFYFLGFLFFLPFLILGGLAAKRARASAPVVSSALKVSIRKASISAGVLASYSPNTWRLLSLKLSAAPRIAIR